MKAKLLAIMVTSLVVEACASSDTAGQPQVAGGQSGTDTSGSYYCDIENATTADMPLDQSFQVWTTCSALDAAARIERTFECPEFGRLTLTVAAPTAAQRLTGVTYSDTGDPGPGSDCVALRVITATHISSADSSIDFQSPSFDVVYTCGEARFAGTFLDSTGQTLAFTAYLDRLYIDKNGHRYTTCQAAESLAPAGTP